MLISEDNGNNYFKINKVIASSARETSDIMTFEEFVAVLGRRASMIAQGSRVMVSTDGMDDVREIAKKEIFNKRCPLIIIRKYGNKEEIWRVSEMGVPLNARESF